jgi:valyl-tRNA synthetase
MTTLTNIELDKNFENEQVEEACRALWDETGIYRYDPDAPGAIFSVDTPPPYVSAAHLHVGHAMSYAQAEFVIRYHRMNGRKVFYPMGFDDNGLPTERYVEKTYNINKRKTTRAEFRALCLEETAKGGAHYAELWKALGLSVDWRTKYSTIDDHCRATSQKSFLDLYRKGRIYRSDEPVLWDTHFETALAQADLDTIERKGKLHDVAFKSLQGDDLVISTTRPELIPACVALYCNPHDERYTHLVGSKAVVPLFGHEVPILTDPDVKLDFGTGLMMVCTFGDGEDVKKWKRDGLDLRLVITQDGKMNALAGPFEGLELHVARKRIIEALGESGQDLGFKMVDQVVSVSDRSQVPVEFHMTPQWFIKVLDAKDRWLARSAEINWHPAWMKTRLDHWVDGLKYDWNISRQRFYGVPFPLWFCDGCGHVILAEESQLPVDPLEDAASPT